MSAVVNAFRLSKTPFVWEMYTEIGRVFYEMSVTKSAGEREDEEP